MRAGNETYYRISNIKIVFMKIMNLHRFIPNRLIVHLIAMQVNVSSRIFLRSRSLTLLNLFAGGGREIFMGQLYFQIGDFT